MTARTRLTDHEALDRIEEIDPTTAPTRDATATDRIAAAVAERAAAEQAITEAVHDARARGVTWVEIATALGVSHQGARQRYGAS
ncbi:hypothetical protein BHE97_16520 [Aeromicrobium sp. PE09-221]|uniref:hypothetical protein n=1 Tax=Aeromicrobium sp. PE09-221 TaxID=1898043 RepID=UPI000B3ED612|nr:hypothetical protein [Aeromicrobium sp. PE09-221]OUZ07553.1 hypothetical protein BHE97_16520 [Aeromicrobium sp. PE09-221]